MKFGLSVKESNFNEKQDYLGMNDSTGLNNHPKSIDRSNSLFDSL